MTYARTTDPDTSREAAAAVQPGASDLRTVIRRVARIHGPLTAEEIAREVAWYFPDRWTQGTIVSACSAQGSRGNRSGLRVVGSKLNSRGRRVQVLGL